MKFSVATFNLQNGIPWTGGQADDPPADLERTITFLRSLDCDVFFLQEVEAGLDGGTQLQPPPNFTKFQKAFSEYHSYFSYPPDNADELPFGIGLCILSRFEIARCKAHHLAAPPLAFEFGGRTRLPSQRLLLEVEVIAGNSNLLLFNTHLQAFFMIGGSSNLHSEQKQGLLDILQTAIKTGKPILLGGDFNCAPDETLVADIESLGLKAAQKSSVTWKRMPFVVDHVFFNNRLTLSSAGVVATDCSDHDAVKAEFEIPA